MTTPKTSSLFEPDFFRNNRRQLRSAVGQAYGDLPIVVTANGLMQRNGDATYEFRQDANFWYLTGLNDPDIVLVMEAGREYLLVPGRDAIHAAFDGTVDTAAAAAISGITEMLDEETGWSLLAKALQPGKVATLAAPEPYIEGAAFYTNPARARLQARLLDAARAEELEVHDIRPQLAALRVIKQAPELQAIRQAIDVTAAALAYASQPERLREYQYEYELEADLQSYFLRRGSRAAFQSIVASGQQACQLHYIDNNGPVRQAELMVLDIGAEVENYAADISRTIMPLAAGQAVPERQRAVHEAVRQTQRYALTLLKPGVIYKQYEEQVETHIGKQLETLGLLDAKIVDHDERRTIIRSYYPHASSHFLGLDVHDVGDYSQPLRAGMVLTCEPGIYIPEEGIGVRIEDDVLITQDGCEVLSAHIPSGL